ncbi:3'(2'),5'-bisphosphate nucleotidase CysQ [Rhodocista pekingensis]|uniref:3'(2'),5'-bisphosphate nucleotidase CysQ n=1 Tax=Rhodocista pekingensis TaxID=201185 RepID=A0ABW2KWN3_9PROT
MTTDVSSVAPLLGPVRALAEEAGRAILEVYRRRTGAEAGAGTGDAGAWATATWKADGSPVTAADKAAEAAILPALRRLTPGIPVVSEEAFAAGDIPAVAGSFWLVDPLDGTKEFLRGNGEFTVNIALVRDGAPVLGVVHAPVGGATYAAAGPGTAVRSLPGQPDTPLAVRPPPAEGLTVLHSRSHADLAALARCLDRHAVREKLVLGSSLKFCRIAEGVADLYPRLGGTMEWDTAAGHAVLAAAGGRVETLDGKPLAYGKTGFANPHFLARGG